MNNGTDCKPDLLRRMLYYYNYIFKAQYYLNWHLNIIQTYWNITRTQSFWIMQTSLTLLITVSVGRLVVVILLAPLGTQNWIVSLCSVVSMVTIFSEPKVCCRDGLKLCPHILQYCFLSKVKSNSSLIEIVLQSVICL